MQDEFSSEEIAWLAGLLEGEGSFNKNVHTEPTGKKYAYPKIMVGMTDEDIIQRVANIFGSSVWTYKDPRNDNWKLLYRTSIQGKPAEKVLQAILPYMGERRTARILALLDECLRKS